MNLERFVNINFHEQIILQFFRDQGRDGSEVFWDSLWTVQFSLTNFEFLAGHGFNTLI